jgi:hypothetical protein
MVPDRERLEKNSADAGEDYCICTNAKRERCDRRECESRPGAE